MGFGGFGPPQGSAGGAASAGALDAIQVSDGAGAFLGRLAINSSDQLIVDDGAAATPGLIFDGDADTGISLGSTDGASLDLSVGGAVRQIQSAARTVFLHPIQADDGAANDAGVAIAGAGYGLFSRTVGQNIDVTIAGVFKHGWARITSGGSPATCFFMPETITSPAICPSITGFNSIDTGLSIGHVDNDNCAFFSEGLERARWNKAGESILDPILTNSTGAVSDTGATQTTDATSNVTLYSLLLADDTVFVFDSLITCRDTAGAERGVFSRRVRVHREGGGVATLGTVEASYEDISDAGLLCTYTVDGSNTIRLSVTGLAGTTINWAARVTYIGAE